MRPLGGYGNALLDAVRCLDPVRQDAVGEAAYLLRRAIVDGQPPPPPANIYAYVAPCEGPAGDALPSIGDEEQAVWPLAC